MILDYENLLSNDQAITDTDGASTNYIDLGDNDASVPTPNDMKGKCQILCQVTEAFVGGDSLEVKVQTDDDSAFGSATTIASSGAIATASLVLGYQFYIDVPLETAEQYLRLYYDVTGTMSAGKITAGIVVDKQTRQ